jgi:hypothetical protein
MDLIIGLKEVFAGFYFLWRTFSFGFCKKLKGIDLVLIPQKNGTSIQIFGWFFKRKFKFQFQVTWFEINNKLLINPHFFPKYNNSKILVLIL